MGDALGHGCAGGSLVASRSLRSACLSASLSDFKDYELDTDAQVCTTRVGKRMDMGAPTLGVQSSGETAA